MDARAIDRRLLSSYLEDHVAAATGVLSRLRLMSRQQRTPPEVSSGVRDVGRQIARERAWLIEQSHRLVGRPSVLKRALARVGETAGRLKLNGRLLSPSPISLVLELELLLMGIRGKTSGWMTLRAWAAELELEPAELDALIEAAHEQSRRVEELLDGARRAAFRP
jgi:hypothetical protein